MGKLKKYGKGTVEEPNRLVREVVTSKGSVVIVVKKKDDGKYPVTRKILHLLFNKKW